MNKSFTLIEIIISSFILLMLLIPSFDLNRSLLINYKKLEYQNENLQFLANIRSELKSKDFISLEKNIGEKVFNLTNLKDTEEFLKFYQLHTYSFQNTNQVNQKISVNIENINFLENNIISDKKIILVNIELINSSNSIKTKFIKFK